MTSVYESSFNIVAKVSNSDFDSKRQKPKQNKYSYFFKLHLLQFKLISASKPNTYYTQLKQFKLKTTLCQQTILPKDSKAPSRSVFETDRARKQIGGLIGLSLQMSCCRAFVVMKSARGCAQIKPRDKKVYSLS